MITAFWNLIDTPLFKTDPRIRRSEKHFQGVLGIDLYGLAS